MPAQTPHVRVAWIWFHDPVTQSQEEVPERQDPNSQQKPTMTKSMDPGLATNPRPSFYDAQVLWQSRLHG